MLDPGEDRFTQRGFPSTPSARWMDGATKRDSGQPTSPRAGRRSRFTAEDFAGHFAESFGRLWRIAVGITRDRALSEDVVQDAAMTALRKLDEFEPGTNFSAWMGQTVRFAALNASRRKLRERTMPLDPQNLDHGGGGWAIVPAPELRMGVSGELTRDQVHFDDELMRALDSVPDTARACLLLRTLRDLEYAEISKVLSIPKGTAMSHVHRMRKALRDRLSPHYGVGRRPRQRGVNTDNGHPSSPHRRPAQCS